VCAWGKQQKSIELEQIKADVDECSPDTLAEQEWSAFGAHDDSKHDAVMRRLLQVAAANENTQREKLAGRIFGLVIAWLFLVIAVLIVDGYAICGFKESDQVMMLLLGTSTANVIGLFVIILKYFYRSSALQIYFEHLRAKQQRTPQSE